MALFVAALNSGSNGNCYYIGNEREAVLIDAGISCRETERRLKRLELSIKKVKGIFVSHEHSDHIQGLSKLSKKHRIPVYITGNTLVQGRLNLHRHLVSSFTSFEPVQVGNLSVTAVPVHHDASDPHGFIVSGNSVNVGVFTDLGMVCDTVKNYFGKCHAAFLEANYDETMLHTGHYPLSLKERIRGGKGHLSNVQAAHLFADYRASFMSHLFLSHLSEENNHPKIVEDLFKKIAGRTEIVVTSRHNETELYRIQHASGKPVYKASQGQLALFQ